MIWGNKGQTKKTTRKNTKNWGTKPEKAKKKRVIETNKKHRISWVQQKKVFKKLEEKKRKTSRKLNNEKLEKLVYQNGKERQTQANKDKEDKNNKFRQKRHLKMENIQLFVTGWLVVWLVV